MEYNYFKVNGGKVREGYDRFFAKRTAQMEARNAIRDEFGASGIYANHTEICGLVYIDGKTPPEGWRQIPGEPTVWKPHGNARGAKEIRARFRSLPLADAKDFQSEVLGVNNVFHFMDGLSIYFMVFENIGDTLILKVPKIKKRNPVEGEIGHDPNAGQWTPPDAETVELKTSEYWQLKEQSQAVAVS